MNNRLDGKVALVTGAPGGFGRAITRKFVSDGAKVVAVDVTDDGAESLQDEFGDSVKFLQGDHCVRAQNEAAVALAVDTWGKLDILVNNAGIGRTAAFSEVDDELFGEVIDVNLMGQFRLTQAALPAMLDGLDSQPLSRSIVFLSSGLGLYGVARSAPYAVSKHGVNGLMRSLAAEYGPRGLRINSICPGIADTALGRTTTAWADSPEEVFESLRQATQLRRLIEPEDIANASAFLVSDDARMIHSVALRVDGGAHV